MCAFKNAAGKDMVKKALVSAVCLSLMLLGMPMTALAEPAIIEVTSNNLETELSVDSGSAEEQISVDAETVQSGSVGASDNDELLNGYVEQRINESLPSASNSSGMLLKTRSVVNSLTEREQRVYGVLRNAVAEIAAGKRTSTKVDISLQDLDYDGPWTASDLGVKSIVQNGSITQEAMNAAKSRMNVDVSKIVDVLIVECPYDLYWFDKTQGYSYSLGGYSATWSNGEWLLARTSGMRIDLYVSLDYAADGALKSTKVRTDVGQTINKALTRAKNIVANNNGKSAYERLEGYKDAICSDVDYNYAAANNNNTPYGNPWQLIWVFDGDKSTNVVCEGYSKAFKYLCDLTWPESEDIGCLLASGTTYDSGSTGSHMWNVVHMDDGANYLVDVTNCDEGSIGYPSDLFMAYGPSGKYNDWYTFRAGKSSISYKYDSDTLTIFGKESLTISKTAYSGNVEPGPGALSATASTKPVSVGQTATFTCSVSGADPASCSYRWQYSKDGGKTWKGLTSASSKTATLTAKASASYVSTYTFRCVVTAPDGRKATTAAIGYDVK